MLLYGESATGKTTLWATFPGPILCLVCSGGKRPGELRSINTPEYRKKITARVVSSVGQAQEILRDEAANYATVVLDHATGFQDLAVMEHLRMDEMPIVKFRKAEKGESWGIVPKAEWTEINTVVLKVFRGLLDLPSNVVIVAQEKIFKGKEEMGALLGAEAVPSRIGGAMTPGVAQWLLPACDYVVQTSIRPRTKTVTATVGKTKQEQEVVLKGKDYCLRVGPHDVYMTKFRVPKGRELPEFIVDPTYDKIHSLINGEG